MKKERRIFYKLVHRDMNKTGLAESISYGDFIPELENRRHLYIKTKYGEDLVIKDEQVLTLEKLSENFVQLGKSGDKNVELSLMFLTKWKNHSDHYTLDGEISFDKLWEGVRPADFIPYLYSTKANKNMVEFVSDLSVFTYDEEETDSANLITLHEKLRLLAQHYKNVYKHASESVIEVYKKFFDIRYYTHIRGPKELFVYGKELLGLSNVLIEVSKLIKKGEKRDFSGLLDKLDQIELFPRSQIIDLTTESPNNKIKIKLLTDNKSPVVSTTNIYTMDTRSDSIDVCTVYHNRYGDIINGYKPSTPEVRANGTGNNNITFEEDGCVYLKGGYKYLVRSNGYDLHVFKYDPVPITHYPLYRNTEFSGARSYQAGTILIGSKGTPFFINTPILNYDAMVDPLSMYGPFPIKTVFKETNLRDVLQYYVKEPDPQRAVEEGRIDYQPMYFPLFELSKGADITRDVIYPSTEISPESDFYTELGNKTGGDFISRWHHGLIIKDSMITEDGWAYKRWFSPGGDLDNMTYDTQFFFPQPTKTSDIKITSIATDSEFEYQNDGNKKEEKRYKFLGFGLNKDKIFNEYLTDYNYGQGARLRLLYTLHYHAGVRRDTSWLKMYNQSIPFKNSVVTGLLDKNGNLPKIFSNEYADHYSYRTYDKYYLEFRTKKPVYPTLKFTSLKDGSVKYLAKKWVAPCVYTHKGAENTITVERSITNYILTSEEVCYLEVRVYNREFTGSVPDDSYYSGGTFGSFDYGQVYHPNNDPNDSGIQNFHLMITNMDNARRINSSASRARCVRPLKNIEPQVHIQDYIRNYKSGVFKDARAGDKYTIFMRITESNEGTNASNWIKIPIHFTKDSPN